MSCSPVTPGDPSPAHHMQGRRSGVGSQLRGHLLHGLWQVTLSVSAPPLSVKQKRARVLWDFFISIYKALCDHQTGGNRGKWTFIVATQVSVTAKLCCLGHDYLPHFIWLVQAGLPACLHAVQSPAWVLACVRSCLALLLLWGHATLGTGLVSWAARYPLLPLPLSLLSALLLRS